MKLKIETNLSKIKNKEVYAAALDLLENKVKEGYFRAKGESEFRMYKPDASTEDAKFIELHIPKPDNQGEYKINGNLTYHDVDKTAKFYSLSVVEFPDINIDEVKMAHFKNEPNETPEEDIAEVAAIIAKIKASKPQAGPHDGSCACKCGKRGCASRQGQRPNGNRSGRNNKNFGNKKRY